MSFLDKIALYESDIETFDFFVDMDGVLTDFDLAWRNLGHKIDGQSFEDKYGSEAFWSEIKKSGIDFWENMSWTKDGKKLWNFVKKFNPTILSSPAKTIPESKKGKQIWIERELGPDVKYIFTHDKFKHAHPNAILIDDYEKKITPWVNADGIGILHTNTDETIKQLKNMGF
jgi:hypothetical protein